MTTAERFHKTGRTLVYAPSRQADRGMVERFCSAGWEALHMDDASAIFSITSSDPPRGSFGVVPTDRQETYLVKVEGPGLTAERQIAIHRMPFGEFFRSLARDWRGWEGPRHLDLAQSLALEASNDGRGRVRIGIHIANPHLDPTPSPYETHTGFPIATEAGAWVARIYVVVEVMALDDLAAMAEMLPYDCYRGPL